MFCAMPERDLYALGADHLRQRAEQGLLLPTWMSITAAIRSGRWSRSTSPGSSSSEVGIEVGGRQLAIVGERPVQETEGRVYQQVEIPSGPFRRVVELQVDVDAERAKATYEDGVLRIELPLRDPAETTRRVPIGRD